jgi:membrane carboxypeptidase/penicillin-binding protein
VDDEPIEIDIDGRIWAPGNFDGDYAGRTTLRRALMRSANAATVRVSRAVGEERVVEAARRNGIVSPLRPVPSIALGALEVSPLELGTAYAPFANGGWKVQPTLVRRIVDGDGTVIWEANAPRTPVMDPKDAFLLTSMLRSVVDNGTGRPVREWGVTDPVAGKTGTTNAGNDVWFVGYTPSLVAGFWFGYDDPRPLGPNPSGGRLAAPAWAEFYRQGWREKGDWTPPAGLVQRTIDAYNGKLANEFCPTTQREWFREGTEPTEPCDEHYMPEPDPWGTDVWGQQPGQPGEPPPVVQEARRAAKKTEKWFKRIFKW